MKTLNKNLIDIEIDQDTMTLLLVGKGPSAKSIEVKEHTILLNGEEYEKPPRLEIGSINESWKIINKVDYSFMLDYLTIQEFKKTETKNAAQSQIKRLVVPSYPLVYPEHQNIQIASYDLPSHVDYSFQTKEFQECVKGIPYYLFQTEASPVNCYNVESFPEILHVVGTGLSAIYFAIARGFRHFIISGFDPDTKLSENLYNANFDFLHKDQAANNIINYYQICYYRMVEKIISSGCTYQRI